MKCVGLEEIKRQADVGFSRKSIIFPCYIKKLPIFMYTTCESEKINKLVERVALRGGWRPLPGLICEVF